MNYLYVISRQLTPRTSDNFVHDNDVIMSAIASQITGLTIAYSTVYSGAYQRIHQSSASLAFVRWIHRWPVNSPHKGPITRKMFPFDDVIMVTAEPVDGITWLGSLGHLHAQWRQSPGAIYRWFIARLQYLLILQSCNKHLYIRDRSHKD